MHSSLSCDSLHVIWTSFSPHHCTQSSLYQDANVGCFVVRQVVSPHSSSRRPVGIFQSPFPSPVAGNKYACPYENCSKVYSQKSNLINHQVFKHGRLRQRRRTGPSTVRTRHHPVGRYVCDYPACGKDFGYQTNLRVHQVDKHSEWINAVPATLVTPPLTGPLFAQTSSAPSVACVTGKLSHAFPGNQPGKPAGKSPDPTP